MGAVHMEQLEDKAQFSFELGSCQEANSENVCRICVASCALVSTNATCRTLRNLSGKLYLSPDEKVLPDFGGHIITLLSCDNSKVCFEVLKTFSVPLNSEVVGAQAGN